MTFLGQAIKTRREQRSMSLQNVADKAKLSKAHIWDLEQGRSANPNIDSLFRLARALELDPCVLAGLAFADLPEEST